MSARCLWAWVVLAGIAFNLAAMIIAPIIRPDLDLVRDSLSYYAAGPWALLQNAAFAAMGVTSLALAIALAPVMPTSPWATLCLGMLVVAAISGLGLVLFPMGASGPHTPIGDAHQTAGTIGGVAQLVAALAFFIATHAQPRWAAVSRLAFVTVLVAIAGAVLTQAAIWLPHVGIPMGVTIRVFLLPLMVLWSAVAAVLLRECREGVRRSSAAR